MFEGSRDAYEGHLQNQLRQRDAQAREKSATSGAAIGMLGAAFIQMRDENEQLKARIAELELALLVKTAHAEGLNARIKGFIAAHPDSPERRDSGKRYKDGKAKSVSIGRYEQGFDAFLASKGIKNPVQYRVD